MNPSFKLIDAGWDKVIQEAVATNSTELRIICPFIQLRTANRLLGSKCPELIHVITRFHPGEMCAGVNDTRALRLLLENGAKIRGVKGLHAKLYLFGDLRAVVTSANLTESAFLRNHEFGFVTCEGAIIRNCQAYFDNLWKKAGPDLDFARLEGWEKRIEAARLAGAPPSITLGLADEGTNAGLTETDNSIPPALAEAKQFFVKFFGEGHNRASLDVRVFEQVKSSGSHWACTYLAKRRPGAVQDGAIMFMGQLVENPHDIMIYGRAIGLKHIRARDEATEEEINHRGWKRNWPAYVRVHNAVFVAGQLKNGVSLSALMDEFKSDSFASTQRHARNRSGNTDPRRAYSQQAQVELTKEAFAWLEQKLELAFNTHGTLTPAELATLDWPAAESSNFDAYVHWSIRVERRKESTAKEYARFLTRCAEHYAEIINAGTVPNENAADQMVARVMDVVRARGRWAAGTFNEPDITQNLTPALRAYGRFSEMRQKGGRVDQKSA